MIAVKFLIPRFAEVKRADALSTTPNNSSPAETNTRKWTWAAVALWVLPLIVISIMVATRPYKRTVTPLYHNAVKAWWAGAPLYDGPGGMNYLPQFTVLFGPYHAFPFEIGDILWRLTAAAGLAWGLWKFVGTLQNRIPARSFVFATILALPLCLGALRNGQANAHFGVSLLLAAWFLSRGNWWAATGLLSLAVLIKPLGLAAVGLAWVIWPHLWWRLAAGLLVVIVLPFLFASPAYAISQYQACFENLRQCSEVTDHRFADLNGIFRTFNAPLSAKASLVCRAVAGLLMALICWRAGRQTRFPPALVWLSAATAYLMLFNPMTEANSYVIFAPAMSLFAMWYFSNEKAALGWSVTAMLLTMGLLPNLVRPLVGNHFALIWHPAMTLVFLVILFVQVFNTISARERTPVAVGK